MLILENFAVSFARAVEIFRTQPDAIREQKAVLRALVALAKLGGVTIRVGHRSMTVDSVTIPPTLPGVRSLIAQLNLHDVAEIRINQNAAPAELLALLRAVAASLSGGGRRSQVDLAMERAKSVRVLVASAAEPEEGVRAPSVTDVFESAAIVEAAEDELLNEATNVGSPGTPLENAMADLALRPEGADMLDRLATITDLIPRELDEGRPALALRAIADLVRLEEGLPEDSPRRGVAITINRLLTEPMLEAVVRLVPAPELREPATAVLQRGGADATEILLRVLETEESSAARRAYFDVLRGIPEGIPQLLHLLSHHEWYVVRNMAELVGDMRVEEAVPALGRAIEHEDERVRKAAAVALARIGTAETVQHIRNALRRGDAGVRSVVAGAVGGRRSGALAMPLVLAAEDEPDPELQRDFYVALARIGTPEALQALIKAAQPGGRFFRRRKLDTRLAAIEGLRVAGGPAAVGALEGLRDDRSLDVRQAARAVLEALSE